MITIKQLTYALAVEQTLHFRKAAEACNISQSAFSTALSEMEKQLGFQVFERNNKQVLVTPLGREVLEKARSIKLQMDDLQRLADSHQAPLSTSLTIGIIPTIGPYLLPIVLPKLQQTYPDLQLRVTEEQSHVLVEQVKQGDLDSAILALPFDIDSLLSFKFWEESFYWVTHKNDPLALQPAIGAEQIDSKELMLLQEGHCLKDHALAACHIKQKQAHSLSATSLATLVQLVAGKMGTTLVPEISLQQLVDHNPNLIRLPLAEPGPHRELVFIVRANYPTIKNIELLMRLFNQELKNYFAQAT
jgi:LysR family hydrogen peroxide-inducible transcriptional activator